MNSIDRILTPVMFSTALLAISTFAVHAATKHSGKITAPSQGNEQNSFTMTIAPAVTPFCNITEVDPDAEREGEAANLPALITRGICGQASDAWELSSQKVVNYPFRSKGIWASTEDPNWKHVISGMDVTSLTNLSKSTLVADVPRHGTDAEVNKWSRGSVSVGDAIVLIMDAADLSHEEVVPASIKKINLKTIELKIENGSGWLFAHKAGAEAETVAGGIGASCLAGRVETMIERGFRYGFCSPKIYDVQKEAVPSTTFDPSVSDYYIVNIVVWDKSSTKTSYSVASSRWYTVDFGDHGMTLRQPLPVFNNDLRIYGTKKPIGLLAIHIRPPSVPWSEFSKITSKYTITVKSKTAANVSDFQQLLTLIGSGAQALESPADPDGFYGMVMFKATAPADLSINAEVDFPSQAGDNPNPNPAHATDPASPTAGVRLDGQSRNSQGSQPAGRTVHASLISVSFRESRLVHVSDESADRETANDSEVTESTSEQAAPPVAPPDTSQNASTKATASPTPVGPSSTCPPASGTKSQSPCTFTATFNDENLYHWDFGGAIPVKTVNELQFSQSSGSGTSVVPKTVSRTNAYAFFDIYPIAADIINPPVISVPHLFAGLPISGKVFNKPIFGVADGINFKKVSWLSFIPLQIQFFGGVVLNKEFRQIPGTTGASNVTGHRVLIGNYGIEIPMGQFKTLIGSAKSKSNGSSATAKSTSSTTE